MQSKRTIICCDSNTMHNLMKNESLQKCLHKERILSEEKIFSVFFLTSGPELLSLALFL